jgi:stress response protein YsnF
VPIGREIEAMPTSRQEGDTTIVPVVEEVIVTRRKLVLKEEVHLRLVRSTEQHRESVILRRQEAVIERLPAGQAARKSDQA